MLPSGQGGEESIGKHRTASGTSCSRSQNRSIVTYVEAEILQDKTTVGGAGGLFYITGGLLGNIARLESLILLRNWRHLPCHTDTGYHLTTHQTETSWQNRPTVHQTKPRAATNTETCATKI